MMKTVILERDMIHDGDLILVNAEYPYTKVQSAEGGFVGKASAAVRHPAGAVSSVAGTTLDIRAADPLSLLMDEIDGRESIMAVSGMRSELEQARIYNDSLRDNGREFTERFVAMPGHSEHETGLAVDLALKSGSADIICPEFPYTGICLEFRRRAAYYGFIERYPRGKERITGISHEPWHFRYVGCPHAEIMERRGITLEEYMSFIRGFTYGKACCAYNARGVRYRISYIEAARTEDIRFEIDEGASYSVSGDNVGGFIITERREI